MKSNEPDVDPQQELKALTRQRLRLLWEKAQLNLPLEDEDARRVAIMREHPEYNDLWAQLDAFSDEEFERIGHNPILHVTIHEVVENQLAEQRPPEVLRVFNTLLRRGLSRHEAVHQVGTVAAEMLFEVFKSQRPFNERAYVRKLRRLVR